MEVGRVGPEGRIDLAGEPIEHDVGQKHVTTEVTIDITIAITPVTELLDNPGSQADGGVREGVGERLRFCPHDSRVARLFLQPMRQLLLVTFFVRAEGRVGRWCATDPEEVDIDSAKASR